MLERGNDVLDALPIYPSRNDADDGMPPFRVVALLQDGGRLGVRMTKALEFDRLGEDRDLLSIDVLPFSQDAIGDAPGRNHPRRKAIDDAIVLEPLGMLSM